jgi:hypothetical protein
MARWRGRLEFGFVGLLILAGSLWMGNKLTEEVSKGFFAAPVVFAGGALVAVAALVVAFWIARSLYRLVLRRLTRKQRLDVRASLFDKAQETTEQHLTSLVRKRRQLVPTGAPDKLKSWLNEIDYFLASSIEPMLSPDEQQALPEYSAEIADHIENAVRDAMLGAESAKRE